MEGISEDGRWLSYTELADLRGISKASATRMSFRHKWRRQAGNDGKKPATIRRGSQVPLHQVP